MRCFEPDTAADASTHVADSDEVLLEYTQPMEWDGRAVGEVDVRAVRSADGVSVRVSARSPDSPVLHWGVVTSKSQGAWVMPIGVCGVECQRDCVQSGDSAARVPIGDGVVLSIRDGDDACDVVALKFCVVVESDGRERWFNGPGGDFVVNVAKQDSAVIGNKVLSCEAEPHWSMLKRYGLIMGALEGARDDPDAMAWLFVVMRLHAMRQLPWYSAHSYQSKDLGHMQDSLSKRVAQVAIHTGISPMSKRLARMIMPFLSRGGGNPEAIRMEILNTMRKHGIKEGHRPGIECHFLEEWHQKLHQHTTPDDILICKVRAFVPLSNLLFTRPFSFLFALPLAAVPISPVLTHVIWHDIFSQAYLHFLHTGNVNDFWCFLLDKGGLTREKLAGFPTPIRSNPIHLPQLIPDMKHYLWILKTVHSGADLGFMVEHGKWGLEKVGDGEAIGWMYEIMQNYDQGWIPAKVSETRVRLEGPIHNVYCGERDLLLLDTSLEGAFKNTVERIDMSTQDGPALINLIELVLAQSSLSRFHDAEYEACLKEWRVIVQNSDWGSDRWALRALAIADKIALMLGEEAARTVALLQSKAVALGKAAGIPDSYIANFSEEVIRSQASSLISVMLHYLVPMFRTVAGVGPWQLVSGGSSDGKATGKYMVTNDLADIQGEKFDENVVVVSSSVDGSCDIPLGVVAVISGAPVDILSHVAIRARNQGVLLACCDVETLAKLKSSVEEGGGVGGAQFVTATIEQGTGAVCLEPSSADVNGSVRKSSAKEQGSVLVLKAPAKLSESQLLEPLLSMAEFDNSLVGGKSYHLHQLQNALPEWIRVPFSMALPFGTFESTLQDPVNKAAMISVKVLTKKAITANGRGAIADVETALSELRALIEHDVLPTKPLTTALRRAVTALNKDGGDASGDQVIESRLAALQSAVQAVWASKWTLRAFLSRQARRVEEDSLFMAVLLQKVVNKIEYAFVLHTADPLSGDKDTLFGEVVVGMGETLVGSYPGRALSFTASKLTCSLDKVLSYPSKRTGIFANPGSIAVRSDSQGEDLEEFAGAGLYDTVVCGSTKEHTLDYSGCRLFTDSEFLGDFVANLTRCGIDVERAMGGGKPQDIEGCVDAEGNIVVVQTRPQV